MLFKVILRSLISLAGIPCADIVAKMLFYYWAIEGCLIVVKEMMGFDSVFMGFFYDLTQGGYLMETALTRPNQCVYTVCLI